MRTWCRGEAFYWCVFLQWNNSYGMLAVSIGGHVLDFRFRFMLWFSILLFKLLMVPQHPCFFDPEAGKGF